MVSVSTKNAYKIGGKFDVDDACQSLLTANRASAGASIAWKRCHPRLLQIGLIVATLAWVIPLKAATAPPSDALVAAAKQEGQLVLYSSESDKQVDDTNKAFEAKY